MTAIEIYKLMSDAFGAECTAITPEGAVSFDHNGSNVMLIREIGGREWAITFPDVPEVKWITRIYSISDLRRALQALIVDIVKIGDSVMRFGDRL